MVTNGLVEIVCPVLLNFLGRNKLRLALSLSPCSSFSFVTFLVFEGRDVSTKFKPSNSTLTQSSLTVILPASGQEHGLLNEDGAGQQDVPAASNVVRAERKNRADI